MTIQLHMYVISTEYCKRRCKAALAWHAQCPPPPPVSPPPPPLSAPSAAAPAAAGDSGSGGGALDIIGMNNLNSVNDLLYVFGNGNAQQAALNKCAPIRLWEDM